MRASVNRPPTPDADDDRDQEPTLQDIINMKLIESGEKERLKELLRERLIECGWRDELKAQCRSVCPPGFSALDAFELCFDYALFLVIHI